MRKLKVFLQSRNIQIFLIAIVVIVVTLGIIGLNYSEKNSNGDTNTNVGKSALGETVTAEQLVASPGDYKGGSIKFVGKVFKVEGSDNSYTLQVYSDIKNSSANIIVYTSSRFIEDDYIEASGTIGDPLSGSNAFGASLTVPIVLGDSVTKIDADQAIAPTVTIKKPNLSKKIGGLTVVLEKIEYAADETRIFLHFDNTSSSDFSFYSFYANLVQGRTKIDTISDYNRDTYIDDSDILAGTERDIKLYYGLVNPKSSATFKFQVTNADSYDSTDVSFDF